MAVCGKAAKRKKEECNERLKRRKTQDLRTRRVTVDLTYAVKMKLRSEDTIQLAKIIVKRDYTKKDEVTVARLTEDTLLLLSNTRRTKYNIT